MPRLVPVGLWVLATLISTAIVWTATSTVAADVTDRPAPVVPRRDVVSQLATVPTTTATPTTTTLPAPTSTTRARTTVPRTPPTTAPAPPTTQRPAPSTTVAAAPPAVTTPPTTQAPSRPTATYPTAGGVVRVACDGIVIQLLSATPADGWSAIVVDRGPITVEVHFVRFGQIATVKAVCLGQPIRYFGDIPTRS